MGVILIACVFVGQALLQAFGIHIPSFRIAGGLLILFVALAMMQTPGHGTQEAPVNPQSSIPERKGSVRSSRLAIILARPGLSRRHRLCTSERLAGPSFAHLRIILAGACEHRRGAQIRNRHGITDRAYREASLHAIMGVLIAALRWNSCPQGWPRLPAGTKKCLKQWRKA